MGHNFLVPQSDEHGRYCVLRTAPGKYKMAGFFAMEHSCEDDEWDHHEDAMLLDYGERSAMNHLDPLGLLTEYVVQPFGSPDILLGRAYLRILGKPAVGFFILQRLGPLDFMHDKGWVNPQ